MSGCRLLVELSSQTLTLWVDGKKSRTFAISSSKYGIGNWQDSYQTPWGKHIICQKMGDTAPLNGILHGGKFLGELAENVLDIEEDLITTRALRLRGCEVGVNSQGEVDSEKRGIWIHGTAQESKIGVAASHGCIRLKNKEMLELFDLVEVGCVVEINI